MKSKESSLWKALSILKKNKKNRKHVVGSPGRGKVFLVNAQLKLNFGRLLKLRRDEKSREPPSLRVNTASSMGEGFENATFLAAKSATVVPGPCSFPL